MLKIRRFSFYWLNSWIMANVVQLATQDFCKRYLNLKNDPCGRQYDQMTQAARSGVANIAEGNSRHSTSKETEMKLTDVARASLAELANDYVNFLMQNEQSPWSQNNPEHIQIQNLELDRPEYRDDILHNSSEHIIQQKHKFDAWLAANDPIREANCILILCTRLVNMLTRQIEQQLATFTEEGGFTEALTAERLQHRSEQSIQEDAPVCPKCGKTMVKRVAKKGVNSGKEFWSCSGYPDCRGTRKIQ